MRAFFLSLCALCALCGDAVAGPLFAAAGKVDVTPDPKLSAVWLAGYGASGRRADGVQHPLYVRAMVLSEGGRTVALVAVDSMGISREDVLSWRRELGWTDGRRYLFAAATHSHSAPDMIGMWGRFPAVSGVDPGYRRRLRDAVVSLVRELSARLEPAEMRAAERDVDPAGLCRDDRDPVALDPELHAVQVRGAKDHRAIGTLVRWSCHPCALTAASRGISADFPGPLCDRIESSGGGACVYMSGAIGGHLIPDTDRKAGVERQVRDTERIGLRIADEALAALKSAEPIRGTLSFSSAAARIPVENSRYLLFLPALSAGHVLEDAGGLALPGWKRFWLPLRHLLRFPLPEDLRPWVETEVGLVRFGALKLLGLPGEPFPELVVGGYDGSRRYGKPLVGPDNPNPPDLTRAPRPPYLRQRLGGKHGIVIGVANDELGYLVPEFDFQATPSRSMLPKPRGTHYEETESVGARTTGILLKACEELLR